MFEESLVESVARIRTRSRRFAVGTFFLQAVLLAATILVPYIHPAALPKQALRSLLVAPPPPAAPSPDAPVPKGHPGPAIRTIDLSVAPRILPRRVAQASGASTPPGMVDPFGHGFGYVPGGLLAALPAPKPPEVVRAKPRGPVRISAGVAAGQLLTPIEPAYPEIAREAHVQGTVVIDAVISTEGTVEEARIVTGPPLLAEAALSAVRRARYKPYLLNGVPIAVKTTIRIIFRLGN
jgi:protein TonB